MEPPPGQFNRARRIVATKMIEFFVQLPEHIFVASSASEELPVKQAFAGKNRATKNSHLPENFDIG